MRRMFPALLLLLAAPALALAQLTDITPKKCLYALLVSTLLAAPSFAAQQLTDTAPILPQPILAFGPASDWSADTARPDLYLIGMTRTEGMAEAEALVVAQRAPAPTVRGWNGRRRAGSPAGGVARTISAEAWRGRRVRLSGRLRSQDAVRLQMWLSARGTGGPILGYNMSDRPIHGTTDWQRYAIVMDVPDNATELSYGFFLTGGDHTFLPRDGKGIAWGDSFTIEAVDTKVPVSRNYLSADYDPGPIQNWSWGPSW